MATFANAFPTVFSQAFQNDSLNGIIASDGSFAEPIIIGDDYLSANGRAISWDVDPVTGFTLGSITCWFGAKRNGRQLWKVQGVPSLVSGKWRLKFELPKTKTKNCKAGGADFSVAVHQGDVEITRVRPTTTTLNLEEKCT